MKKLYLPLFLIVSFIIHAQTTHDKLSYHNIRTDTNGNILPWYSDNLGDSYDHVVNLVWHFWDTMRTDLNGLPYYMNHQVWKKEYNDPRGIGGDQISMALSSWQLLYAYTGFPRILDNIKFMADYYLSHSLSPMDSKWPNLPYPYNTLIYSGIYDGDMIMGKGYTQPDKAGSFGYQLIMIYELTGKEIYLEAAENIANTLCRQMTSGDNENSPLPFRVNPVTGKIGIKNEGKKNELRYSYTTNWTWTMMLFTELIAIGSENKDSYQKSFQTLLDWMKNYPLKTNKWGPFFEDIEAWSDTQINAVTFAQYILENPQHFPDYKENARHILDWVYHELGNNKWKSFGVTVVNEQTDYRKEGNSHTARQAAAELLYALKTGDKSNKDLAIRQLNWATYMVNDNGESSYPSMVTWLTDGFGDFVRHYLNSMGYFPELAPAGQNHLLKSSSAVKTIKYDLSKIEYETAGEVSTDLFRLAAKPAEISVDGKTVPELSKEVADNFYIWTQLENGGILKINHKIGREVSIRLK